MIFRTKSLAHQNQLFTYLIEYGRREYFRILCISNTA
jgi:hypothetical protein